MSPLPSVDGLISADQVLETATAIASWQLPNGMIPWFPGGHADPWNHVEAAMALDLVGMHGEAVRAYQWLVDIQHDSGAWHQYYLADSIEQDKLDANTVAYLDLGGSGNETQAHLAADGRITLMFCAFENPALILRLYGRGVAVLPQDEGFVALAAHFPRLPGVRQVFRIHVDSGMASCGWGVPRMTLESERETLVKYHAQQDPAKRLAKIADRTASIDGLPLRVQAFIPPAEARG